MGGRGRVGWAGNVTENLYSTAHRTRYRLRCDKQHHLPSSFPLSANNMEQPREFCQGPRRGAASSHVSGAEGERAQLRAQYDGTGVQHADSGHSLLLAGLPTEF